MRALDIVRGVADHDALFGAQRCAVDEGGPLKRGPGQLAPVGRVGPVTPKGEEPVELGAMQLDVGRRFQIAGHDAEQVAILEDPVILRVGYRLMEVVQPSLEQLGELGASRLPVEHGHEGLAPHVGSVMPVSVNWPMSAGMP
ncbi:MAG: hypothetical protein ABI352_09590 [Candidatus Dormibacter sp.]